jgi:hypothetical protein
LIRKDNGIEPVEAYYRPINSFALFPGTAILGYYGKVIKN